jgi:phosphoribosylamine-glycine ligase
VWSIGTEDVCFVESLTEARRAFDTIIGKVNLFGEVNAKVLVQEFLQGTEYVVDCVSKDGVHKVRQKPFTTRHWQEGGAGNREFSTGCQSWVLVV